MNVNTQTQGADSSQTSKAAKVDKPKADISFEVGFKDDLAQFNMRFITLEEETEAAQKLNDIADAGEEKNAKEYKIMLEQLARFSESSEDGEKLREVFKTRTNKSDRIIRSAYWQFRGALLPTVNFH